MPEASGRQLGVAEALLAVTRECPSGKVREAAEHALQRIKQDPSAELAGQIYFILTTTRGWQGARAHEVRSALNSFLESTTARGDE